MKTIATPVSEKTYNRLLKGIHAKAISPLSKVKTAISGIHTKILYPPVLMPEQRQGYIKPHEHDFL